MLAESDLKIHVRQVVNQVKNRLSSSSNDPRELCRQLQRLIRLLPDRTKLVTESTSLGEDPNGLAVGSTSLETSSTVLASDTASSLATNLNGLVSDTDGSSAASLTRLACDTTGLTIDTPGAVTNLTGLATDKPKLKTNDIGDRIGSVENSTGSSAESYTVKPDQTGATIPKSSSIEESTVSGGNTAGLTFILCLISPRTTVTSARISEEDVYYGAHNMCVSSRIQKISGG